MRRDVNWGEEGYSDEGDIFQWDAVQCRCPLIHSEGYAFFSLNSSETTDHQESDCQSEEDCRGMVMTMWGELGMEWSV